MNKIILILLACCCLLGGCEEFIEPSLEGKITVLLAPENRIESTEYQQVFWWKTRPDALHYRLQIVSPAFDSISKLIMDTVISGDKFVHTLDPGEYEWRVRAENGSSQGSFQARKMTIFSSSIKDQQVQLNVPATGFMTFQTTIEFSWMKLFGAESYRFQLDDRSFIDEKSLILDVVTDNQTLMQKFSFEGLYQWRVRAEGSGITSNWSPVRTLIYDVTPPNRVVLKSPANKQVVNKPVRLSWDNVIDVSKYEMVVYKSDSTAYDGFPQIISNNFFSFNSGESGEKILWRVRAIDRTGNVGPFSDYFSFNIQ